MIQQALFPLRSYSVPLAKKIGINNAIYLFFLIEKYGDCEFQITLNDLDRIGIKYTDIYPSILQFLIKSSNAVKIDFDKLNSLLSIKIATTRPAGVINEIRFFIDFLKTKGKHKTCEEILVQLKDWTDEEILESLRYSRDNGFVTIYRKSSKKAREEEDRERVPGTGGATSEDSKRDYSKKTRRKDN